MATRSNRSNSSRRITAKKWMGDCPGSWAVFVNGQPVVTGLTKGEVPYHRRRIEKVVR